MDTSRQVAVIGKSNVANADAMRPDGVVRRGGVLSNVARPVIKSFRKFI